MENEVYLKAKIGQAILSLKDTSHSPQVRLLDAEIAFDNIYAALFGEPWPNPDLDEENNGGKDA